MRDIHHSTIDVDEDGNILFTQYGRVAKDGTQERIRSEEFAGWAEFTDWVEGNDNVSSED